MIRTYVITISIAKRFLQFCLVSAFFLSTPLQAGTIKKHSFDDVVAKSDLAVVGRCLSVESTWVNKKIISLAKIHVDKVIKGEAGDTITIEYLGGEALHPKLNIPVAMKSTVEVEFSQGDEAVLLLNKLPSGNYSVIDMSTGKIPISTDAKTGKKYIKSGFKKIASKKAENGSTELKPRDMELDEFYSFFETSSKNRKVSKENNKK